MDSAPQVVFDLKDRGYLSLIRRELQRFAVAARFSSKRSAELDIVFSEISSNLLKHASGGQIILRSIPDGDAPGVEIISIDDGPGMTDPQRMVEDGISTTNTLGQGLGAIRRLSDQFQIFSTPGWGSVVLARLFTSKDEKSHSGRIGVHPIILAKPGEEHCGDRMTWKANSYFFKIMLADGLGHGLLASQAAEKACQIFQKSVYNAPHQIMNDIHLGVKNTRGLVATIAVFDFAKSSWQFSGVGNISTRLCNAISNKAFVPFNGIVGVNMPKLVESQLVKSDVGNYLIMCSDGISSRWDISKYSSLFRYDQSILASAIYKDFARHTDDTSVVVVKV